MQEDFQKVIEARKFAPSFEVFKKVFLVKARFFAILTARGNSPDNFQKVFLQLNDLILNVEEKEEQYENIIKNYQLRSNVSREEALQYYFVNIAYYISCSNPQIEKICHFEGMNMEDRKAAAILPIIQYFARTLKSIYEEPSLGKIL